MHDRFLSLRGINVLLEKDVVLQKKLRLYSSLKSLQIINALLYSDVPMSISDISKQTTLSVGTIHRILQDLLNCDFVAKQKGGKTYSIGLATWNMALRARDSYYLISIADDEMNRLNNLTLETIHLVTQDNYEVVYLSKLDAKNQIGLRSKIGERIPLYNTSVGKVILSWKDEAWLEQYFSSVQLIATTPSTICDETKFREELEMTKQRIYAIDNKERHPDIVCIAAPIFDSSNNVISAISVSAPEYRFSLDNALSFSDELLKSASTITEKLGGTFPITKVETVKVAEAETEEE